MFVQFLYVPVELRDFVSYAPVESIMSSSGPSRPVENQSKLSSEHKYARMTALEDRPP